MLACCSALVDDAGAELGAELMSVLMGGEKTKGAMSEGVVVVEREADRVLVPANSAICLGRSRFLIGGGCHFTGSCGDRLRNLVPPLLFT